MSVYPPVSHAGGRISVCYLDGVLPTAKAIGEPLGRASGSPTLSSLYPQTDRVSPGQTLASPMFVLGNACRQRSLWSKRLQRTIGPASADRMSRQARTICMLDPQAGLSAAHAALRNQRGALGAE